MLTNWPLPLYPPLEWWYKNRWTWRNSNIMDPLLMWTIKWNTYSKKIKIWLEIKFHILLIIFEIPNLYQGNANGKSTLQPGAANWWRVCSWLSDIAFPIFRCALVISQVMLWYMARHQQLSAGWLILRSWRQAIYCHVDKSDSTLCLVYCYGWYRLV